MILRQSALFPCSLIHDGMPHRSTRLPMQQRTSDERTGLRPIPTNLTMMAAVSEIHDESDQEPDDQPNPVPLSECIHHVAIEGDAEHWNSGNKRSSEGPRAIWVCSPQDQDRDADDYEGK